MIEVSGDNQLGTVTGQKVAWGRPIMAAFTCSTRR